TQLDISLSVSAPTVVVLRGKPPSRQQSSVHCAYSCQLHLPAFAKCKMPPSTARSKNCGNIPAISCVYVGVENLSPISPTLSFSCARLIIASIKLGRSGPNTQETRTTRWWFPTASTFFSLISFDSP